MIKENGSSKDKKVILIKKKKERKINRLETHWIFDQDTIGTTKKHNQWQKRTTNGY